MSDLNTYDFIPLIGENQIFDSFKAAVNFAKNQ